MVISFAAGAVTKKFVEEEWLSRTFESTAKVVSIPDRSKIWYFTNRIFRLDVLTMEWSEFDYPRGWDPDFNSLYLYPSSDLNSLIAYSKSNTLLDYQAMWFNLETGKNKIIASEPGFFDRIRDIKEWKAMPGCYLIMKTKELWSYNVMTGDLSLVMDGFSGYAQNIMQDKTGKYLYTLGDGNGLYILDLIERSVVSHLLPIHEGDSIMFSGQTDTIYDPDRGRIIAFIRNDATWGKTLAVIKLDNYSVHYIEGLPEKTSLLVNFNQRENRLITSSQPYIFFVDLDTKEVTRTASLMSNGTKWSATIGELCPTIIPERSSTHFRILGPLGSKKLFAAGDGNGLNQAIFYPGNNTVFLKVSKGDGGYIFREYDLENGRLTDIELTGDTYWEHPDLNNDQIITFGRGKNAIVQFLKTRGKVRTWAPEHLEMLSSETCLFDPGLEAFWAVYQHLETFDWHYYRLSTSSHKMTDSFTLSDDIINYPSNLTIDPSGRYFYFFELVDKGVDIHDTTLVIFDIDRREITGRIKLQENVVNDIFGVNKVTPGIITLPGQDRVFLWGGDRGWLIDTTSNEIIYGDLQVNPLIVLRSPMKISGFWDEERQLVVVVDFSYAGNRYTYPGPRLLEIEPDTGQIINESKFRIDPIRKVFISSDKSRIYMLSEERAHYYVLNLTPRWENPATIGTRTNYLQYVPGDNCRLSLNVRNSEKIQNTTLFAWLCLPGDSVLFFNGLGWSPEVTGIPLTLPADIDLTGDILNYEIPPIMPEGFYNFNAIFMNENYEFGPMGTWNFQVGK